MNDFEILCRGIVEDFLQTAVVFDDRARLSNAETVSVSSGLKAPGKAQASVDEESSPQNSNNDAPVGFKKGQERTQDPGTTKGETENEETAKTSSHGTTKDKAHELDARELIISFAQKGIVCAVVRPLSEGSLEDEFLNIARRSDIVILDWQIARDNGATSLDLIKKILEDDAKDGIERLRLFVFYTGEDDGIIDKALQHLNTSTSGFIVEGDPKCLRRRHAIIAFHGKDPDNLAPVGDAWKVPVQKLPEALINDFTRFTKGILPSVALESLSAIRKNTHRILSKMGPELDAPYVTHRSLLSDPSDAEDHLIPLVSSEIQSAIENYEPKFKTDYRCLEKWLDCEIEKGLDLPAWLNEHLNGTPKVTYTPRTARELVLSAIDKGRKVAFREKGFKTDKEPVKKLKDYTNLLSINQDGPKNDHSLAIRMSTRTRYEKQNPILALGTIVKDVENSYWVCVQPLCDSVRLKGKSRFFPFLPLSTTRQDDHLGFVVEDNGTKELSLLAKPFSSILKEFGPAAENEIRGVPDNDGWFFLASDDDKLRYIAELKPDHAQRVALEYGQQISRVGVTESEWLRRWAGKGFGD